MVAVEGLPVLPHQASELYAWLWWRSEEQSAVFDLGGDVGRVELWVDDRLAFRSPHENKVSAVMTGDDPANSLEARAALAGGKVLQEVRLHLRRDDREYTFSLKGPSMDLSRVRLPQQVTGGEEAVYDRMFLYEELCFVLAALVRAFAAERSGPSWDGETLPALRAWVMGRG